MGGPDRERSVSLDSGEQVAAALERGGTYAVERCIIQKPTVDELHAHCAHADVVLPILHGPWGEGGPLQTMLETIGVRFLGSRANAAATAMDKIKTKIIAARAGIQTPQWEALDAGQTPTLEVPVVFKPNDDGSSFGVEIHRRPTPPMEPCLCEQFIHGRELTVAVLGGEPLPTIEIVPSEGFYDFAAKYDRSDTTYSVAPELDPACAEQIAQESALICHEVGVRHLARVDWLLDEFGPWFLEVNTMPGMTTHSLLPMAAAAVGLDMPALCERLVEAALDG
jgi:D-alanine-D-alanine ligase